MTRNLADELHRLAHSGPGAEAARPGATIVDSAPRLVRQVHRRRAARHAGAAVAGASLVAALAVGGSALKAHVDAAGGPSTALSKRAGATCGKPFNGAGKSDPRFTSTLGPVWNFEDPLVVTKKVLISHDAVELSQPTVKLNPARPATAVFLKDGIVVGITDALTDWELLNRGATARPGDDTAGGVSVPANEITNCTGVVPSRFTNNMFDLVVLSEYRVGRDAQTALVVSPPVKGPWVDDGPNTYTPPPGEPEKPDPNTWWHIFLVGDTAVVRGDQVEFRASDYLAVMDVPGANVPLYYSSPDGSIANGSRPYTGPAEAHITEAGSMVVTYDGVTVFDWTKTDVVPADMAP